MVDKKNGVIYLVIMFNPRPKVMVTKISKMPVLYFTLMTAK